MGYMNENIIMRNVHDVLNNFSKTLRSAHITNAKQVTSRWEELFKSVVVEGGLKKGFTTASPTDLSQCFLKVMKIGDSEVEFIWFNHKSCGI